MLKTKDYNIFKFRKDNRENIHPRHVKRVANSIQKNNILHLRPILVNEDLEVIDGQHRLKAAELLGEEIYYEIKKDLKPHDIVNLNLSKSWDCVDFLNYYCQNGYTEYLKLKDFAIKNNIPLRLVLTITQGESSSKYEDYKLGNFVFENSTTDQITSYCWETISYIKKMTGKKKYLDGSRFWKSLIRLFSHPLFDIEVWRKNVRRMPERFGPRISLDDYYKMMLHIYNWRGYKSEKAKTLD